MLFEVSALEVVLKFFCSSNIDQSENVWHSKTRDEFQARLARWLDVFSRLGGTENSSVMLSAVLGELGNNAFDHNIGKWADQTGCLVGFEDLQAAFRVTIADRGQGIISSLGKSVAVGLSAEETLKLAFEKKISGRSPERRGNGLKFVSKQFHSSFGLSLVCVSGGAMYSIGTRHACLPEIERVLTKSLGTLIVFDWSKE